MNSFKTTGKLALISSTILCFLFQFGCYGENKQDVFNAVRENIKKPEVQAYIVTWVSQHVVSNCEWRATGGLDFGIDGVTKYYNHPNDSNYPVFEWSKLGVPPSRINAVYVYGKYDDPDGVMFIPAGTRFGVIYSFKKHPSEFNSFVHSTKSEDFIKITDEIYFFKGRGPESEYTNKDRP